MKIKAHFTQGQKAETLFQWKKIHCQILDSVGVAHFDMAGVEAPVSWSEIATSIAASKYFRQGKEKSVRQMVQRVVQSITKFGLKKKYFSAQKDAQIFAEELSFILLSQRALFNSPVWFNCGLYENYKIRSQNSLWAWDFKKKKPQLTATAYEHPQASACFIQSIEDSLEGIFTLAKNEAMLFKYGSGTGTNFSSLRSKYENIDGGGKSSGLLSFLDVLDRGAGSIKSGGVTRRAAKMVILDIDHPEIEEFIEWKRKEEDKAEILVKAGYSADFEGEAYKTLSGQNANLSVRVNNRFLKAVEQNANWVLRYPSNGKKFKELPARELWQKLTEAAWRCADPGLLFNDQVNQYHTCKNSGEIRASNPCCEFLFLDDSACNLASINLLKFLRPEDGLFDFPSFLHTCEILILAQEILVDYAGYPTQKICENSHNYRPLGVGFAGLGAMLMRLGLAYDSPEARAWAGGLTALLSGQCYYSSAVLAKRLGAFSGFKKNKKSYLGVFKKQHQSLRQVSWHLIPSELQGQVRELWTKAEDLGKQYGFRHAQLTLMAPTGTIGLVMDSETTGIEPEYSLLKSKQLAGGGKLVTMSESLMMGLRSLGYSEGEITDIVNYVKIRGTVLGCETLKKDHEKIFYGAKEISPQGHLLMMAAIQPFLSGGISKTVNLRRTASVEDVSDTYLQAWKLGLKSIAIYRDGSKGIQPLLSEGEFPKCTDCGAPTEFAGGCFRCTNCGSIIGCA